MKKKKTKKATTKLPIVISLFALLISLATAINNHLGLNEAIYQTKIQKDTFEAFKSELDIKQAREMSDITIANSSKINVENNLFYLELHLINEGINIASIDNVEIRCYLPDMLNWYGSSYEDSIVYFLNRPINFQELITQYKTKRNITLNRKIEHETNYPPLDKVIPSAYKLRKSTLMKLALELEADTAYSKPFRRVTFYAKISIRYSDLIYNEKHLLEKIVSFRLIKNFKLQQHFANTQFAANIDSIPTKARETLTENINTVITDRFTGQVTYY